MDFEVKFGKGNIGLAFETDYLNGFVQIKSIQANSLSSEDSRLKIGSILVSINGIVTLHMGYDITVAKYEDAAKERGIMVLTFRESNSIVALKESSVNNIKRNRSLSSPGFTEVETDLTEDATNCQVEQYENIISGLKKKLRSEICLNIRSKDKIQMLICNQQLLHNGSVRQAEDVCILFALRLLAMAFVLSTLTNLYLPEIRIFHEYVPLGFAIDEWCSILNNGILTYAHFYLAMCQGQERNTWITKYGVVFIGLLFLLNEGHGVLLATSALNEAQMELLKNRQYTDQVQFIICAQKYNGFTQSCHADAMTMPLVYFLQNNFSNYLYYGANLALMVFSMHLEDIAVDENSSIVRNLTYDLKMIVPSIHAISLTTLAIHDDTIYMTIVFAIIIIMKSKARLSKKRLVLNYLTRVSICTLLLFTIYFQYY